jgi:hypothetical protein
VRITQPWLALHPCATGDVLALMLGAGDDAHASAAAASRDVALGRYMRAWWSLAGGAVGAALPASAYRS